MTRPAVTEEEIANAVKRGITPARIELAYMRNEINRFKRSYNVRCAVIVALRERWDIQRTKSYSKP